MLNIKDFEKIFPWPEIELASFKQLGYEVRLVVSLPFTIRDEAAYHEVYYWVLETQKNGRTSEHGYDDLGDALKSYNSFIRSELLEEKGNDEVSVEVSENYYGKHIYVDDEYARTCLDKIEEDQAKELITALKWMYPNI